MDQIYNAIGGEAAIDATVDEFYKRVLQDPLLKPFFEKTDMKRQHRMQKKFLNHVFGGKPYDGLNMKKAHKNLHLTDEHFDHVAKHLSDAMIHLGVSKENVKKVMDVAETTRNDVLGREPPVDWVQSTIPVVAISAVVVAVAAFVYYRRKQ